MTTIFLFVKNFDCSNLEGPKGYHLPGIGQAKKS